MYKKRHIYHTNIWFKILYVIEKVLNKTISTASWRRKCFEENSTFRVWVSGL